MAAIIAPRVKPSDDELRKKGINVGGFGSGLGGMEAAMATAGQEQGLADVEQTKRQGAALNNAWDVATGKADEQAGFKGGVTPWAPQGPEPAAGGTITQGQPFKSTLSNGIEYTADQQGNRTFSMGTPGQDGYGKMTVRNGSALQGSPASAPAAPPTSGLSFEGSAADAARFNAPIGSGPQMVPTGRMIQAVSTSDFLPKESGAPAMPQPIKQGMGVDWRQRADIYKEQMDAYKGDLNRKAALGLANVREQGDNSRALLTAQGVLGHNAIQQQQVDQLGQQFRDGAALRGTELEGKQIALGDVKTMQALKDTLLKGDPNSPEYQAAYTKWSALNGKNEKNFGVIDRYDENGQKVGADLYNTASGTVMTPRGAALPQQVTPAPQAAIDLLKKDPKQAAFFKQKYGYLP